VYLIVAKRLSRQCFVSGDLGGIAGHGKGEVVGIICRVIEKELQETNGTSA
jgi:hypothetical protein